ncbi:uncharacterized protein ARMOST_05024 [Armillaria ostoyae]|uniref:Uncharacterized protein n=1 Tax=Armillaria ostoyae TaxID=47428 RepID=A0A284QYZ9_ARMOS|nr:uncharacterized protein ARMOST_05024 [Armillaria ostoyae]
MLRLERRPNEGPYLVATGVPPQVFDEWSTYDSAYHMFYDHDSQSVFSFHDPSPQHEAATMQFLGAFQQGYIDLYNSKSSTSIISTRGHLYMGGSSCLPLRDGSTKEPDAGVCIIRPGVGKPRLARCFVFECAYMNEDEATLVSETLRWADSGHFSVSLKIQDVVGWPLSPRLTFYTADRCGAVVMRYIVPHDAVDPRPDTNPSAATLEELEQAFRNDDTPLDCPWAFQHKLNKVPEKAGKLEKCYKMLGLPPKLSKNISVFERLRAQQGEGREYYFEESGDEGDDGTSRPPLLEPEEVKDGVLVDGCCIPISISALYGDNPPPSPLTPDDQLLVDVFSIRTHVSYAVEDLVMYTEQLRESVEAVKKGRD